MTAPADPIILSHRLSAGITESVGLILAPMPLPSPPSLFASFLRFSANLAFFSASYSKLFFGDIEQFQ